MENSLSFLKSVLNGPHIASQGFVFFFTNLYKIEIKHHGAEVDGIDIWVLLSFPKISLIFLKLFTIDPRNIS